MTPLETLQKYGLATDVKSVKERVSNDFQHFGIAVEYLRNDESLSKMAFDRKVNILEDELRTADLALLCELAEIGERENKLLELYRQFFKETNISIDLDDCDIDDVNSTFEYVDIENDKAKVDTVKRIQELEAEGEGK